MQAETLKLFRINLLRQMRAAAGGMEKGCSVPELVLGAKTEGHSVNADTVRDEVLYLVDKKQAELVPAEISPEVKSYRITAVGRDWLATQAL